MLRPPEKADMDAILELLAARERADAIEPMHWQELVLEHWRDSDFDPALDAVIAVDDRGAAGFAALFEQGGFVAVHPEREGEGAGTGLLAWLEQRDREQGREHHRQIVGARNQRAVDLLARSGYRYLRSYVQMEKPLEEAPLAPLPLPGGVELARPDPSADAHALHLLDGQAFSANLDYQPHTFERFVGEHVQNVDPELSAVAMRNGRMVGMALCQRRPDTAALLDLLAVVPRDRNVGLGAALLQQVFARSADAGLRRVVLFTASDNATAIRLYQRAGMAEVHRADVFEKPAG